MSITKVRYPQFGGGTKEAIRGTFATLGGVAIARGAVTIDIATINVKNNVVIDSVGKVVAQLYRVISVPDKGRGCNVYRAARIGKFLCQESACIDFIDHLVQHGSASHCCIIETRYVFHMTDNIVSRSNSPHRSIDIRAYQALVWSRISEIVILGDVYFPLPFQGGINA